MAISSILPLDIGNALAMNDDLIQSSDSKTSGILHNEIHFEEEIELFAQLRQGHHLSEQTEHTAALRQAGGILFSGTVDGHVNGWSLSQNRRSHRIPLLDRRERTNTLTAMDVLESGTMAVGFSSGRTVLVDVRTGERTRTYEDHTRKISAAMLPSSAALYSTSYDGVFQVRDLETEQIQHHFCACECPLSDMQLAGSVNEVLLGSLDGQVRLLDLRQRACAISFPVDSADSSVRCMTVDAADRNQLYLGYGVGNIQARDLRSAAQPRFIARATHQDVVNVLSVNHDMQRLFSGGDDRQCLMLDAGSGATVCALEDTDGAVMAMTQVDGEIFIAGAGKNIRRYDITSLFQVQRTIETKRAEQKTQLAAQVAVDAEALELAANEAKSSKKSAKVKGKKGEKEDDKKKPAKKKK